jgi:hypothetical protein
MMSARFRTLLIALLCTLAPTVALRPAAAQGVLVAPPGVFIDHRTRSGSLELYNPNPVPAEVTISTIFGYPVTDSTGQLALFTSENPPAGEPSAAEWIQAYPRRLILAPSARQTVRLLGRPPAGLADGEYWTRLVIAARTGPTPVDSLSDTASIRVGLAFEVRTVIGVWYRKGEVTTGLELKDMSVAPVGDSVALRLDLSRIGSAAFLGVLRATVNNREGKEVGVLDRQLAVYRTLQPVFMIPSGLLPPGEYTVQVSITTDRSDFHSGVIAAPPIREQRTLSVPARAP